MLSDIEDDRGVFNNSFQIVSSKDYERQAPPRHSAAHVALFVP
jgi:hypothetical protein